MSMRRWSIALVGITVILALTVGCPTTTTPGTGSTTGNAANGQTLFTQSCSRCHSAGSVAQFRDLITNNMGTINLAMIGITLTDQQVADLQAYLATQ